MTSLDIIQSVNIDTPAHAGHWSNVVLMLARRLRRRPNIKTTLGQCLVSAAWDAFPWTDCGYAAEIKASIWIYIYWSSLGFRIVSAAMRRRQAGMRVIWISPMLAQYWLTVFNSGLILTQLWVDMSYLPQYCLTSTIYSANVGRPSSTVTQHWTTTGLTSVAYWNRDQRVCGRGPVLMTRSPQLTRDVDPMLA